MKFIRAVIIMLISTIFMTTCVMGEELYQSDEEHIIFVGDSRTVGMDITVEEENVHFIGKVGSGYDWLKGTALKELDKCIKGIDSNNIKIVFNHGVNDPSNLDKYIGLYEQVAKDYKEYTIYFMSVNPCKQTKEREKLNNLIEEFNSGVREVKGFTYIDSYSYLEKNGFESPDGLHYSNETYAEIYGLVVSTIEEDNTIKELRASYSTNIFKASRMSKDEL